MNRRDFTTALGAVCLAPLPVVSGVARSQQLAMPVVGFLRSAPSGDGLSPHFVTAFRQGLEDAGFVDGRNVAIELRFADNQPDRLLPLAAELIRRPVAVIVGNTPSALAAKVATTIVPIVFVIGSDPIALGLVANLNRPDGNVTGVVFFAGVLGAKRLELLNQLVPNATPVAVLVHPDNPDTEAERKDVQAAAEVLGRQLIIVDVPSERDFEAAFGNFVQRGAGALLVGSGPFMNSNREALVALAARHGLPACFSQREGAVAGGLMSYGSSITDAYRQAGIYAGRILKGEKPADLPVIRSTKLELVINLKAARALGLTIPEFLLARADEVIE